MQEETLTKMPRMKIMRMFNVTSPILDRLRGGPVLRMMTSSKFYGDAFDLIEPSNGGMIIASSGIMYMDLADMASFGHVLESPVLEKVPIILDVHFPIMYPDRVRGLNEDGTMSEDPGIEVYWMDPDVQERALQLIRDAAVVTTPNSSWARDLRPYNKRVVVLPDVQNPRDGAKFARQFCHQVLWAVGTYESRKSSLWYRLLRKFTYPFFIMHSAGILGRPFEEALAELDIWPEPEDA